MYTSDIGLEMYETIPAPIRKFLEQEEAAGKSINPPKDKILRAFLTTPIKRVKCIIIGQDVYPKSDDASGLAFSVDHNHIPASLNNIFKELHIDEHIKRPSTGSLESWANRGVLLINSILTCETGKPMSHMNHGWEEYTNNKIQQVLNTNNPCTIICWGKYAQRKIGELKLHEKALVITGGHPSPRNLHNNFIGGRYFSRTNAWLKLNKIEPINWSL